LLALAVAVRTLAAVYYCLLSVWMAPMGFWLRQPTQRLF